MTCVLRVRRTDKPGQHLLLHVETSSKGKALDLKLIGTEHEHLYHASTKESNLKTLQASSFSGDLDEWKGILKYALLHDRPEGPVPESLQGVEAVGSISANNLTVTLRKNIGGIAQRLGSIKLDQDDEREAVNTFEWVDAAVATADDLRTELETLQASVSGQQEQVAKLNKQLDDLVKAKKEHEDELLKKFAALLNAKKLKIRDQQRLLTGSKIDQAVGVELSDARGSGKGRQAGSSRKGKRKAAAGTEPEQDEDDDMADANGDNEEEERPEETPPHSDQDATEDEDDVNDMDDLAAVSGNSKAKTNGNGKAAQGYMDIGESEELPPRRELPFARKDTQPAKQPEPTADDDDETDDEL